MKRLLSAKDVQIAYGIGRTSLWRKVKSNEIPTPVKINGRNYWSSAAVAQHIEAITGGAVA